MTRWSLLGTLGLLGLLATTPACHPRATGVDTPDAPAAIATNSADTSSTPHSLSEDVERLRDESTRTRGLTALEQRITAVTDDAGRQAIADAMLPAFVEIWDDAPAHRSRMLRLCLALKHPDAAPVWNRAIGLDGSAAAYELTLLALDGVGRTRATGSLQSVLGALLQLVEQPRYDEGEGEKSGQVRAAMIRTLGELGDPAAVPTLVGLFDQSPELQPIVVYRQAVTALGRLGDPAAVDALLTAAYLVPDIPSTNSIAERAKTALVAIGEPAVPSIIGVLEGRHQRLAQLIETHSIHPLNLTLSATGILGAIGSASAVESLLELLRDHDCKSKSPAEDDTTAWLSSNVRAVVANALGFIGDERAVEPLCRCALASHNPAEMYPIAEALGRIGGTRATACLARTIEKGRYDADLVSGPEYRHEIRWEAARFGLLAAGPDGVSVIEKAMNAASRDPEVATHMKGWKSGRALLERCGRDVECLSTTLSNPSTPWFAREVAAVNLARLSPRDAAVAEIIAGAYDVRNPDARVSMAWLAGYVMQGERCSACADALHGVIEQESDVRPPKQYQLSILMARYAMAKLRGPVHFSP